MEITAKLINAPLSAQKGRLIADCIRNTAAASAVEMLKFTPKKGAKIILKLLESAVANAENKDGVDIDELRINKILIDQAKYLKRTSPRAKGRANQIKKHNCHIKIVVSSEE